MTDRKLKTPFADLLPPLSTEEREALASDIKRHGVRDSVVTDEDGNILDGHNRYSIDPTAPVRVISGLSEDEKRAFVIRANMTRRNLSPTQKTELRRKMQAIAKQLRESDPKKWTQKAVADVLGVAHQTVSLWFGTNSSAGITSKPDARTKVPPQRKPEIASRVESGESREQVAADFGITGRQVATIATSERKKAEQKEQHEAAAKKITGNCGVIHGDFRVGGLGIDAESVDLVFTDPPYDAPELYGDLATFSARVLRPGGWLLAYSGHAHLGKVMELMRVDGMVYGWTFCVLHSGGDSRFRKFKVQTGWKPILGFYKPPLSVDWDWFKDVVSGGKEKDLHEWQQAESEAAYFVDRMSVSSGFVCDPFCGSGTTLAAAKAAGRRWIGFEVDSSYVDAARVRVA